MICAVRLRILPKYDDYCCKKIDLNVGMNGRQMLYFKRMKFLYRFSSNLRWLFIFYFRILFCHSMDYRLNYIVYLNPLFEFPCAMAFVRSISTIQSFITCSFFCNAYSIGTAEFIAITYHRITSIFILTIWAIVNFITVLSQRNTSIVTTLIFVLWARAFRTFWGFYY